MYRISTFLLFCALFTLASGKLKLTNSKDLNASFARYLNKTDFNGVVLLMRDDQVLFAEARGFSDLERNIPLQLEDAFVIGSISKQVTAALVLQASEKKLLQLDDKISTYLPELSSSWSNQIQIHHLLTHTHGIVALDRALAFEPGTQFSYSQLGYELLAQILEKIQNTSFMQLTSNLFQHLGMTSSFHPEHAFRKNPVKSYEADDSGTFIYAANSLENYAAAGSLISTAADLAKWNQNLHAEKIVSKKSLKLMKTYFATRLHPVFGSVSYGYGLIFEQGQANTQVGALGYAPGFVSACYYYPKTKYNLIVLENTARQLEDFKQTFAVHTHLMNLVKNSVN